jgi:hypothetical protein
LDEDQDLEYLWEDDLDEVEWELFYMSDDDDAESDEPELYNLGELEDESHDESWDVELFENFHFRDEMTYFDYKLEYFEADEDGRASFGDIFFFTSYLLLEDEDAAFLFKDLSGYEEALLNFGDSRSFFLCK